MTLRESWIDGDCLIDEKGETATIVRIEPNHENPIVYLKSNNTPRSGLSAAQSLLQTEGWVLAHSAENDSGFCRVNNLNVHESIVKAVNDAVRCIHDRSADPDTDFILGTGAGIHPQELIAAILAQSIRETVDRLTGAELYAITEAALAKK